MLVGSNVFDFPLSSRQRTSQGRPTPLPQAQHLLDVFVRKIAHLGFLAHDSTNSQSVSKLFCSFPHSEFFAVLPLLLLPAARFRHNMHREGCGRWEGQVTYINVVGPCVVKSTHASPLKTLCDAAGVCEDPSRLLCLSNPGPF